jgi:hypothetical protein
VVQGHGQPELSVCQSPRSLGATPPTLQPQGFTHGDYSKTIQKGTGTKLTEVLKKKSKMAGVILPDFKTVQPRKSKPCGNAEGQT